MNTFAQLIILFVVAGLLLLAGVAWADDPAKASKAEPPWQRLEEELREKGVSVEKASLVTLAKDTNADVSMRWSALEILGWRGEKSALEDIRQIAHTEQQPLLIETAALALARLGQNDGKILLKQRFEVATSKVRKLFLASRLAELGDASGYDEVVKSAQSPEEFVRYTSVGALVCFLPYEGKKAGNTLFEPLRWIRILAKDSYPKIREQVLIELPLGLKKGLSLETCRSVIEQMSNEDADAELRSQAKSLLLIVK